MNKDFSFISDLLLLLCFSATYWFGCKVGQSLIGSTSLDYIRWYQSEVCSCGSRVDLLCLDLDLKMPPRRNCEIFDEEETTGEFYLYDFRALQKQVQDLQEEWRKKKPTLKEDSDDESKEDHFEEVVEEARDSEENQILKAMSKIGKRPKIEVFPFVGSLRLEELIDWVIEIDEYFEYEEIEDPDRVKFAKNKLKGHANIWWREVQLERSRRGKEKITKWNRMVDKLKKKFILVDYELDMFKKMQALKQTNKSVQEYIEEFYRILIRTGHSEADKEKVSRYVYGLRPSIQEELLTVQMTTIGDAYQMALKIEEKLNKRYEGKQNNRNQGGKTGETVAKSNVIENPKTDVGSSSGQVTKNAGQRGRWKNEFTGTCYNCGEAGHRSWQCPKKRVALAAKEDIENVPEKGECLVTRRLAACVHEPVQRRKLFRTRCKCNDKVCNVIVDGGSSEKFVSDEMVSKLNLERRKHPNPYQISWIQDVSKVRVEEQCLFKFQIGSYHDEILCDVLPMDACHQLLGRPWQFDMNVLFDGRANTYVVRHEGARHKLIPLQEIGVKGCGVIKFCPYDKPQEQRVDEPIPVKSSLKEKENDISKEFVEIKRQMVFLTEMVQQMVTFMTQKDVELVEESGMDEPY